MQQKVETAQHIAGEVHRVLCRNDISLRGTEGEGSGDVGGVECFVRCVELAGCRMDDLQLLSQELYRERNAAAMAIETLRAVRLGGVDGGSLDSLRCALGSPATGSRGDDALLYRGAQALLINTCEEIAAAFQSLREESAELRVNLSRLAGAEKARDEELEDYRFALVSIEDSLCGLLEAVQVTPSCVTTDSTRGEGDRPRHPSYFARRPGEVAKPLAVPRGEPWVRFPHVLDGSEDTRARGLSVVRALNDASSALRALQGLGREALRCRSFAEESLMHASVAAFIGDGQLRHLLATNPRAVALMPFQDVMAAFYEVHHAMTRQLSHLTQEWQQLQNKVLSVEADKRQLEQRYETDVALVSERIHAMRRAVQCKIEADGVVSQHVREVQSSLDHHADALQRLSIERDEVHRRVERMSSLIHQRQQWERETAQIVSSLSEPL
jgi:predicted  nucleic acid-binding Zn-ribbon protein